MERRAYKREDVELPAQLMLGGCLVDGKICDCSTGGYFFYPEVGYFCGEFIHENEILNTLSEGDILRISVFSEFNMEFTTTTEVRWIGQSAHHKCNGLGLQNIASQSRMAA